MVPASDLEADLKTPHTDLDLEDVEGDDEKSEVKPTSPINTPESPPPSSSIDNPQDIPPPPPSSR